MKKAMKKVWKAIENNKQLFEVIKHDKTAITSYMCCYMLVCFAMFLKDLLREQ